MADLASFLFAAVGTLGYAVTYNIPKKLLPLAALAGGIGWVVFCCFPSHPIYGCFFAALSVGILGEIFARKVKDAATLFILPGILPLVPGARMYRMTLALLDQDFSTAATLGMEVLCFAGSIAIALVMVTTSTRMLFKALRLWKEKREKRKEEKEREKAKTKERQKLNQDEDENKKRKESAARESDCSPILSETDPEPAETQREDPL